jgi:hypothetical protein
MTIEKRDMESMPAMHKEDLSTQRKKMRQISKILEGAFLILR